MKRVALLLVTVLGWALTVGTAQAVLPLADLTRQGPTCNGTQSTLTWRLTATAQEDVRIVSMSYKDGDGNTVPLGGNIYIGQIVHWNGGPNGTPGWVTSKETVQSGGLLHARQRIIQVSWQALTGGTIYGEQLNATHGLCGK